MNKTLSDNVQLVLLTPRQASTVRSITGAHAQALRQSIKHSQPTVDRVEDPKILVEQLTQITHALTGTNENLQCGGGHSQAPMTFSAQELADIQQFAMRGMTLAEKALEGNSDAIDMVSTGPEDLVTLQHQLVAFRSVFAKLTLAMIEGSGAVEVRHRLPCPDS